MRKNHSSESASWSLLFAAWLVALVSTMGVLFIGEVMGQAPCVLCWYQRVFMFPLAIILGLAAWRNDAGIWRYALPLAALGGLVALYHTLLYYDVIPKPIEPCGAGPSCSSADMLIFGSIPIPALSVFAFIIIAILLLAVHRRSKP